MKEQTVLIVDDEFAIRDMLRIALAIADYHCLEAENIHDAYRLIVDERPDLVLLDEAQRIKNWNTKTAKAVKQLDSPYAFVLTGTPLENRLPELHSLVEFLHPRALGPRWRVAP